MTCTLRRVVCLACFLSLLPCAQPLLFSPITKPGHVDAHSMLTFTASIDAWLFVDVFSGIHDRMFVQVCVGDAPCPDQDAESVGDCAELTRAENASGWRSVQRMPDDCLQRTPVSIPVRAEMPNRIVMSNLVDELRPFARPPTPTDGSVRLRVRLVYETFINRVADLRQMRSNAYDIVLAPIAKLQASAVLHIKTECAARGLTSPQADLPPAQRGSTMAVYPINASSLVTRFCAWTCASSFIKFPHNAQVFSVDADRLAVRSRCRDMPDAATFVSVSFVLASRLSPFATSATSLFLLAELDDMALRVQEASAAAGEELIVLFSLRNSVYNIESLRDVSTQFQNLSSNNRESLVNTEFIHTQTRRLLSNSQEDWLVDTLFVSDSTTDISGAIRRAQEAITGIDIAQIAPELAVSGVFDVDVEKAYYVSPGWRSAIYGAAAASASAGSTLTSCASTLFLATWSSLIVTYAGM